MAGDVVSTENEACHAVSLGWRTAEPYDREELPSPATRGEATRAQRLELPATRWTAPTPGSPARGTFTICSWWLAATLAMIRSQPIENEARQ